MTQNRFAIAAVLAVTFLTVGACSRSTSTSGAARQTGPRAVPVVVAPPVRKAFDHEVEALGTVRANESVDLTAKVADRVTAIRFNEGQQVRKGEVLIELDTVEARADLAAAQAAASDSRSQFKRSQELFQTKVLSEAQRDQVQATLLANEARVAAAQSRVDDRIIRAPFAGRVGLRNVSLGGLVSPGNIITTLDDLSVVKLDFSVPELFLSTLKQGLVVEARSSAYPADVFTGRVASVDTRIEPSTRSVAIRAVIGNEDRRLRPGMFMTVKLMRPESAALMLPEQAIVPQNDRHFVFVVSDGVAHEREVKIGRRRPGEVEILDGLAVADNVVIDGTLELRNGTPVSVQQRAADAGSTGSPST